MRKGTNAAGYGKRAVFGNKKKSHLKFWKGWVANFKKPWGLRVFKSYGEAGDADLSALEQEVPKLKEELSQFNPKGAFNCDESVFFFRMAPDTTIATECLPGRKKAKDRINLMPYCNADGTRRFELVVIGKYFKPGVVEKRQGWSWASTTMRTRRHA